MTGIDFMRVVFALTILVLGGVVGCGATEDEPDAGDGVSRYALLVGCTSYANLPRFFWLRGPANDVDLMRRLLIERFDFPPKNVHILAEESGDRQRPIRANIEREFRRLAETAKPGADVVIYLAGHGSYQPDNDPDNPADVEPDGFDEVFCPADVQRLEANQDGGIPNAISDDQLGQWLSDIVDTGASVLIIVDACHSGTVIRGSGEEIDRALPADVLLPEAALQAARDEAMQARTPKRGAGAEANSPAAVGQEGRSMEGGLVAIYASQPGEPTVEKPLPAGEPDRKRHGLFTYTLARVLNEATAPLTYSELVARVHSRYVRQGRSGPTPLVEGPDRDREVLGRKKWPARSRILLKRDEQGRLAVSGGSLIGLSKGSVLAVYSPPGAARLEEGPLGYVRVSVVRILEADAVPCAFDNVDQRDDLPDGGRCEIAELGLGDLQLRVTVDHAAFTESGLEAESQRLAALLRELAARQDSPIGLTDKAATADWFLRPKAGKAYLVPAEGVLRRSDDPLADLVGPVPDGSPSSDSEAAVWLEDRLVSMAQSRNLLRIAAEMQDEKHRQRSGETLDVRLDVLRLKDGDQQRATPVRWQSEGIALSEGDVIQFRVQNRGRYPVDVTLLYIDGTHRIDSLFPQADTLQYNRVEPNQELRTEPCDVIRTTGGLEHVVLIAPRGQGPTVDFSWLARPTLQTAEKEVRSVGHRGFDSPLGRLMRQGIYGASRAPALQSKAAEDVVLKVVSWRTTGFPERYSPQQKAKNGILP